MNIEQAQAAYSALKKELGARNFALADRANSLTKIALKAEFLAIKNGKKMTAARFMAACEEIKAIKSAFHSARGSRKSRQDWGKTHGTPARNIYVAASFGDAMRSITNRHPGHAVARAKARRLSIIRGALPVPSVSGAVMVDINFTALPECVNYSSRTEKGEKYTKSSKWRKTDLSVSVTMPQSWITRVYKRGLSEIGGLFNLDISTPLRHNFGSEITVYAAKWLVASRGTSFNVVDGFIATGSRHNFHGKTMASAVAGLRRKTTLQEVQALPRDQILTRAAKSDAWVTVSDSLRAGNCSWGTLDFCRRNGIDPEAGISAKELAKIVALEPRPEAFAALAYAIAKKPAKVAA